jgi:hypothetical protein
MRGTEMQLPSSSMPVVETVVTSFILVSLMLLYLYKNAPTCQPHLRCCASIGRGNPPARSRVVCAAACAGWPAAAAPPLLAARSPAWRAALASSSTNRNARPAPVAARVFQG